MTARTYDSGHKQRRMVALAAITAVHLFIGWAFITGFGQSMMQKANQILETTIIKADEQKDLPPPPPKPEMERPPPPSVPIPIINVNVPIDMPAVVVTKAPPPPRPVAVIASTPVKTMQVPDCRDEYYPPQAQRLGQEGTAVVRICFSSLGKVDKTIPVQVLTSSGFPLLDEATGKCMAAGRFKAATVEGKPVPSCKDFRVKFQLKEDK